MLKLVYKIIKTYLLYIQMKIKFRYFTNIFIWSSRIRRFFSMIAHKTFKFRKIFDKNIEDRFTYFLFRTKNSDVRPYNWYKEFFYSLFLIFIWIPLFFIFTYIEKIFIFFEFIILFFSFVLLYDYKIYLDIWRKDLTMLIWVFVIGNIFFYILAFKMFYLLVFLSILRDIRGMHRELQTKGFIGLVNYLRWIPYFLSHNNLMLKANRLQRYALYYRELEETVWYTECRYCYVYYYFYKVEVKIYSNNFKEQIKLRFYKIRIFINLNKCFLYWLTIK